VPRHGYAIGVPEPGDYHKIFDSDEVRFGGSGYNRQQDIGAAGVGLHGNACSLKVDLPPLGAMFFVVT
jgi:1,4-alpha-glucan branching enzyme